MGALVSRRRQIIEMITAEKNRLGFALKPVQKGIKKHIRWLERQLADVDNDIDSVIRDSTVWCQTGSAAERPGCRSQPV